MDPVAADPFDYRSQPAHHHAQGQMAQLGSYYRWVLQAFRRPLAAPVVDAGAGAGNLAALLVADGIAPLILLEGGTENVEALRSRFEANDTVSVIECDLAETAAALGGRPVRSVVTLDVLEHLPDDVRVVKEFLEVLEPGGRLFVKVPAHPWLYGSVDKASGHYRRYTKQSLSQTLRSAGFEVELCKYMNVAGVAPYFLKSRILRREANFSRTFTAEQLRRIDRSIPKLRMLDRLVGPPVGLSVLAVARKAV